MAEKYDFIAIGDIVVDEFVRLKEASVHCNINHESCEICMRFADKVPFEEAYLVPAVGNSPNAAVAAARLGLKSALVTNLGDDEYGRDCLAALRAVGVAQKFVKIHPGCRTNHHYVLWYQDERTILIRHEVYPYVLPDIDEPSWIYLSSMGETSLEFHSQIAKYLADHPSIKIAFQPGTYQIKFGVDKLKDIYTRTEVIFCNKEESQKILKTEEEDVKKLLAGMRGLGPQSAVITDGKEGAYASDGKWTWFMPGYPDPKPPLERTGAGDAFSSTFTAALCLGLDMETALRWAPINSMSVVQGVGAQAGLLTREQLLDYLKKAPPDYAPKII